MVTAYVTGTSLSLSLSIYIFIYIEYIRVYVIPCVTKGHHHHYHGYFYIPACTGQHADCPLINRIQHLFSSLHEGSISSESWDSHGSFAEDFVLRLWVRWLLDREDEEIRSFGALASTYQTSQRNIPEDDSLKVFYSVIRNLEIYMRDISSTWWWLRVLTGVHRSRRPVVVATKILTVVPNIWGSSVWKLSNVILPATCIFRWLPDVWKIWALLKSIFSWQYCLPVRNTWNVLKCGAGEGWRRPVGPITWEMKKCYLESMSRGISYMK